MFRVRFNSLSFFSLAVVLMLGATGAEAQTRRGMTWTVVGQQDGYVHVGADGVTNPYQGDTSADQYLPLLCVNVDYQPAPPIAFDFYNGWVQGNLQATNPIQGLSLTSQQRGNEICAQHFGWGYRMAEFHDGRYGPNFEYSGGWSFWGAGSLPWGTRFWTAINDQPANPWNSSGVPQSAGEILASIDGPQLVQIARYGTQEELDVFLAPVVTQIGDYVEANYGEDIRADLAGYPEAALLLTLFYYGRENGVTAEDFENGGGGCTVARAAAAPGGFDCFMTALDSVLGISDIRALYRDFTHGVSARTIVGAVKQMGKRIWWSVSLVVAAYHLGDCLGLW